MTVTAMTAAQHHDAVIVLASVAIGIAFAAIVALPLLALLPKRRPTPPVVQPRVDAAPTRVIPTYRVTSLPPRPIQRPVDETLVLHRVVPVYDLDATQFIPRQGGRHAAR